ncbi:MAG: TrkA family potassium uptake protein [Sphaerochaetaceae bacterium]|nr:TrkA family potassium uptake protein [Sphaerochaetaceae bacterium]
MKMSPDNYAVIGVGAFGSAVAKTLSKAGKNVIAIDVNQDKLKAISGYVSQVYRVDALNRLGLREAGVGNCPNAIIGIGKNLEASILATLECIELGVPNVISKASSADHGKILEKLGAKTVFPEVESGEKIARSLMSRANLSELPLSDDFSIISLDVNPAFCNKTISELNWRAKYGINIIAIIKDGKSNAYLGPNTVIPENSSIVLSGNNTSLDRFREVNAKGL